MVENNLILFNKALDSKEYFNKLKFRFELLLIIEKIVKETIYLSSPQQFLAEMLKFSKHIFPANDFYFYYNNIELSTGSIGNEEYIFEKTYKKNDDEPAFLVRVSGRELQKHDTRLLGFIINHIFINIYLWNNYDYHDTDHTNDPGILEDDLSNIKEKAVNILSLMGEESVCDNIYLFIKNKDKFDYIADRNKKPPQFNRIANTNILDRLLLNAERIQNSFYELYDNEKHYYSALFSHKTGKLLLMPVRSQERLEAVMVMTNPGVMNDDLERILELYKLYFEKLTISYRKKLKSKEQYQLNTMNNIVVGLVESSSGEDYQERIDLFFRHFNNYFRIKRMGIFFLDDKNDIKNWYRTSPVLECPENIFEIDETKGIINASNGEEFEFLVFIYDQKRCGCILYEKEKNFDEEKKTTLMHMSMLIFNILYSKQIYEKIKEIDRLAVLGGMAREMAHEIRNPLGGIRLYIEMLKKKEKDNYEIYDNIEKGIHNIENVISDMLSFTRKETLKMTICDFNGMLRDSLKIINLSPDIKINLSGFDEDEESVISCDSNKLSSVLNNILINASQALRDSDEPEIRIEKDIQDNILNLTIWNNGGEIGKEIRKKIFDPFFTTRKNGNGLGLSICKKIINAHNGKIEVMSRNGWTGFKISLPLEKGDENEDSHSR